VENRNRRRGTLGRKKHTEEQSLYDRGMRTALMFLLALAGASAAVPPITFTFSAGNAAINGTQISAVTIDAAGNTYLTGNTNLGTLPVTPNALQPSPVASNCPSSLFLGDSACNDAFIVKLDPSGNVLYATYLGGSGDDYGTAIAVDAQGNIYVAGFSYNDAVTGTGIPFPVTPGAAFTTFSPKAEAVGFLAKANPAGQLVYSTYLPITSESGINPVTMTIDAAGNAYVALAFNPVGAVFPTTPGAFQSAPPTTITAGGVVPVIAKLNASGSALVWATYLCGSGQNHLVNDAVGGIAVDAAGDVFVAGRTISYDFPVTPGAFQTKNMNSGQQEQPTAFVTELNPQGTGLIYSTYLGGSLFDLALAVKVDAQGEVTVLGRTSSVDFPTTENLWSFSLDTGFIARLSPGGTSLVYSSFVPYAGGLDLDSAGNAYIAGRPDGNGAFLWRLSSSGQITGSEGLGPDSATSVAVAPNGSVVMCGTATSPGFPGYTGTIPNGGFAYATSFFINATIMNAASFSAGTVAAGELVAIRGYGFPLATGESTLPDSATGKLPTNFAGVTVMFDEFAAPLLYVQGQQINAQVPWEIAGRSSTQVQVIVAGAAGFAIRLSVEPAVPGIFYVNNSDGTKNSVSNPAKAGDVIAIYGTGGGAAHPAGVTGALWPLMNPPALLNLAVSVSVGGETAHIEYAGASPLNSSGVFQINARLPANFPSLAPAALVVTVGGASSPGTAFTIAVSQ
jgi:uncharacterized protein (TIGR03437 family)